MFPSAKSQDVKALDIVLIPRHGIGFCQGASAP